MTFNEWFEQAYGPRPFPEAVTIQQLLNKTIEIEAELTAANLRYTTLHRYIQDRDAAAKAWIKSEQEHMNSGSSY